MQLKIISFVFIFWIVTVISFAQKKPLCDIVVDKKAEQLFQQARKSSKGGETGKAANLYRKVIAIQDNWAPPYYYLGLQAVRRVEKDPSKENLLQTAISNFEKVAELCPDYNKSIYLHLGKLYYTIGNYKKAVENLETFLEDTEKLSNKDVEEADLFLEYSIEYEKLYGNPVAYDPKPIKNLSTSADEYLAMISPANNKIFFTRRKMEQIANAYDRGSRQEIRTSFCVSNRLKDGTFDPGNPLPFPFNQTQNEGIPTITVDNRYMVFTKCADEVVFTEAYYNCDLYYSEFIDGRWTAAKNMGENINRTDSWESQASISPDGQVLFFVSNREGGVGGYDIYWSKRNENGVWGKAENVGKPINTEKDEKTPFFHADEKTLYYSSNKDLGLGGYDIYFSRYENHKWKSAKNMGYPINTENDELGFFVNVFGDKAYLVLPDSGSLSICEFELYEAARPDKVILIKGRVNYDASKKREAHVELKNIGLEAVESIDVDDYTGDYAVVINDTTTDYLLSIKHPGYVYYTKYIATKNLLDEDTRELTEVNFDLNPIEIGESYTINDVYFESNSWELTSVTRRAIDILVDFMNDNPSIIIELQGHTDNIGNRSDNFILSEFRAKEVYNYMISKNIDSNRLKYKGYADTMPIADNATDAGRAKNRRTVFVILKK